jgi:hypothetical protein
MTFSGVHLSCGLTKLALCDGPVKGGALGPANRGEAVSHFDYKVRRSAHRPSWPGPNHPLSKNRRIDNASGQRTRLSHLAEPTRSSFLDPLTRTLRKWS